MILSFAPLSSLHHGIPYHGCSLLIMESSAAAVATPAVLAFGDPDSRATAQPATDSAQEQDKETGKDKSIPRSQSIHKHIQPPRYVRSIPIGLQRANTISSPTKQSALSPSNTGSASASSPVASSKTIRSTRTSVPYPPADAESARPQPPRSESALGLVSSTTAGSTLTSRSPVKLHFSKSYNGQPDRTTQSLLFEYGDTNDVSALPNDPKTWTPSQLSIYVSTSSNTFQYETLAINSVIIPQLSHMLRLTPRPVIADVMKFVVQRGLTGKRFLRLRNQDLIEMGININCEHAMWIKLRDSASLTMLSFASQGAACYQPLVNDFAASVCEGESSDLRFRTQMPGLIKP